MSHFYNKTAMTVVGSMVGEAHRYLLRRHFYLLLLLGNFKEISENATFKQYSIKKFYISSYNLIKR